MSSFFARTRKAFAAAAGAGVAAYLKGGGQMTRENAIYVVGSVVVMFVVVYFVPNAK